MKKVLYSAILLLLIIILVIVALNIPIKAAQEVKNSYKENESSSSIYILNTGGEFSNSNLKSDDSSTLRLKEVNGRYINVENSQEVYYKQDVEKINSNRGLIRDSQVTISS